MQRRKKSVKTNEVQRKISEQEHSKADNMSQDFDMAGTVKYSGQMDHSNTLTNLLMYESEYVPKPANQLNAEDLYPTYYEDNTNRKQQMSCSQESEDMLFNFLLKLINAIAFRIRILQRSCFESIFSYRHPRLAPSSQKDLLDLSSSSRESHNSNDLQKGPLGPIQQQSESSESKRQSLITFYQQQQSYQKISQHSIPNGLSFNPGLKRKPKEGNIQYQKKPLQISISTPCVKNSVILAAKEKPYHQKTSVFTFVEQKVKQKLKNRQVDILQENAGDVNEQNSINSCPSIRSYPEVLNSSSDNQDSNEVRISPNRREFSQDQYVKHLQKLKIQPRENVIQRPVSYFMQPVIHPSAPRPISNFQIPTQRQNHPRSPNHIHQQSRPISNIINQFSNPFNQVGNVQLKKNINITYQEMGKQYGRAKSENPKITIQYQANQRQIPRSPPKNVIKSNQGMIKIVRSQYYGMDNQRPPQQRRQSIQNRSKPPISMRSAPSSPMVGRVFQGFTREQNPNLINSYIYSPSHHTSFNTQANISSNSQHTPHSFHRSPPITENKRNLLINSPSMPVFSSVPSVNSFYQKTAQDKKLEKETNNNVDIQNQSQGEKISEAKIKQKLQRTRRKEEQGKKQMNAMYKQYRDSQYFAFPKNTSKKKLNVFSARNGQNKN